MRILAAAVVVVCAEGYAATTVGAVCARARVSRRGFYACFDGLEDCFLAVLDDGYRQVSFAIETGFSRAGDWREGMRLALAELLLLFDRRPEHARVWLVEARAAGAWALARHAENLELLLGQVVERWPVPEGVVAHPLAAAGVIESVLAIVQKRAVIAPQEPMIELLGPLMGLVAAPYLDERAVAVEIDRACELARQLQVSSGRGSSPEQHLVVPALLSDPRAHRARATLVFIGSHPGASNRQVADALGISGHTQVSALLARLRRDGLVHTREARPGHPNSWSLTAYGHSQLGNVTSHTSGTPTGFTVTS